MSFRKRLSGRKMTRWVSTGAATRFTSSGWTKSRPEIAANAWVGGDPGLIFIDAVNRANPTPQLGPLEATNPCGELPLVAHESCNLGSIRLDAFSGGVGLDWGALDAAVDLAVRFLDDVVEVSRFPFPEIDSITSESRTGISVIYTSPPVLLVRSMRGLAQVVKGIPWALLRHACLGSTPRDAARSL